jgi:hypothetical protein
MVQSNIFRARVRGERDEAAAARYAEPYTLFLRALNRN